jgi:carboxypeptidase Taq
MSVGVRCGAEAALWTRARTVCRLRAAAALLTWDQHTALPAGAQAARARQLAEIERVSTEQLGDPEVTALLDELEAAGDVDDADTPALVRVLRREHDKARLVPLELRVEIAGAASEGLAAWSAARRRGRFDDFAPALERQVQLRRRYAACFADVDEPYDVCVDDFDPGARTRDVEAVLGALKERLVPIAAALRERSPQPCPAVGGPFPAAGQRALATELLRGAGLDLDRARLADAAHPMTIAIDRDDVGVAMRFRDGDLDGVWLALHELGHALYEQGFDPRLAGSPLAQGASASWHEAQARLFENHVGRHPAFLRHLAERLGHHAPAAAGGAGTADRLVATTTRPRFSPIRLEADELTYALHIVIRFDLERALLGGRLAVADLPAAWAARHAEDLGVTAADERDGVLQDVQWALGAFGYFPTYAIGCVIAAQLWERLASELPGLEDDLVRGHTAGVAGWLREHVWSAGRRHTASELLVRATGGGLSIEPYVAHLAARFG